MAAINKRKLLESAQKNLQKGAVDKALKDYEALLGADPRDANVRLKVGDLKLRLGKADEAIAAYLKVADQFTRDGFDAKAVAIYKQVSKLDPKRYDVFIPLADLYQRLGLTSEAMVALQTAAEAYQRDGRKREALDLLRRMASLDATNTTSRLKVAELLLQEGLAAEALVEFTEAAAELDRQGDWEARATVLVRVVELAPDNVESCEALVTVCFEHNQSKRAEPYARKLVAADPERAESLEVLAQILSANGDEPGAIDFFRKAADAWIARGMEDRARAILQRHIPSEPFDFGGTTDPLDTGALAGGARESDSPFGEVGIGGEPLPLDDEFAFVDDDDRLEEPPPPVAPVAPEPKALPKRPEPKAKPEPKPPVEAKTEVKPAPPARTEEKPAAKPAAEAPKAPAPPKPEPVAAKPAPAPKPAPPEPAPLSAAAIAEADAPTDPEQLLAEAGVYLRYGKRERAVASLEELLASEPAHVAGLELLGEVYAGAEDNGRAVEAWTGAVHAAIAAGDATRAASIRTRIEAIDAAAAAALPAPEEAGAGDEISLDDGDDIEIDIDAAEFGDAAEASPSEADASEASDDAGFEIDPSVISDAASDAAAESPVSADASEEIDLEMEIDVDSASFTAQSGEVEEEVADEADASAFESTSLEADEPATESASLDDDIEVSDDFAFEVKTPAVEAAIETPPPVIAEVAEPEQEPEPEPEPESEIALELEEPPAIEAEPQPEPAPEPQPEAVQAAAPSSPPAASEFSSTTSAAIHEELEEASFYFEQGLLDEAESIYLRIVQRAPNHPAALLRLGEIAVARGHDAAEPVAESAPEPIAVEAPEAAPTFAEDDHPEIVEPPDDLDLTAREFGPQNAWDDDTSDDDANTSDAVTASQPPDVASADAALDVTSSSEAPVAEVATPQPVAAPEPPAVVAATPAPVAAAPDAPELTAPEMAMAEESGAPAFDLAAELSEALDDAAPATRAGSSTDEDGFASLFSEFKRGVSRTLGEGDVETHFDLGIAYREMGLFDDAIGEFHYALGSGARRLDALHMMGLCALDLGRAVDAIGHLEQALASPDFPDEREAPLRFDLARAHEAQGDRDRALDAYRRVAELDAEFQDVGARIEALLAGPVATESEADDVEADEGAEAYESFDDLIAESADEAAPRVEPEAETYESFDEFSGEHDDEEEGEGAASAESDDDAEAPVLAEAETEAVAEIEVVEAPIAEAEAEAEPEPEAQPEPEPEPPASAKRRRKISFF